MKDVFTAFICRLLVEQFTLKAYTLLSLGGKSILLLMQRILCRIKTYKAYFQQSWRYFQEIWL